MRIFWRTLFLAIVYCGSVTSSNAKNFAFNRRNLTAKSWDLRGTSFNSEEKKLYTKELPYFAIMQLKSNGKIDFFSGITNCKSGSWQMRGNTLSLTLVAKEKFEGLQNATKATLHFTRNVIGQQESPFDKGKMLQVLTLEGKYRNIPIKYVLTEFEGMGGS